MWLVVHIIDNIVAITNTIIAIVDTGPDSNLLEDVLFAIYFHLIDWCDKLCYTLLLLLSLYHINIIVDVVITNSYKRDHLWWCHITIIIVSIRRS